MKTTPTAALEALLNVEPLHIHIRSLAKSSLLRFKQSELLIENADFGHTKLWPIMSQRIPELNMPCDSIAPAYRFEKSFSVNIPDRSLWRDPKAILHNGMSWFTDGSKNEDLTGSGIFCPDVGKQISVALGEHLTVFTTEITGILECCREISSNHETNVLPINICTDSQGAIKAISGFKFSSSIVLECRDALQEVSNKHQISLIWVPGPSGIFGNEKADELARLASSEHFIGPEPAMALSFSSLNRLILNSKTREFKSYWNDLDFARQSKVAIRINNRNTRYYLSLSRNNLRRLAGILTGHSPLKKHLHTIGVAHDPYCEKCGEVESAEHLLCKCPAYTMARARHLGSYVVNYGSIWSHAPSDILKFLNKTKRM